MTVALAGAPVSGSVDGRPVPHAAPVALRAGAVLTVPMPSTGVRTYVAVRGGLTVAPVLGSRSYDVLARLGPPPLADGDVLPVGAEPGEWPNVEQVAMRRAPAGGPVRLTGWAGPHADALAPRSLRGPGGWSGRWTVNASSDRTGLRLEGVPLARRDEREWPVEGVVRGAVQLPPSGLPVVLLADHPVTGGYPAVGCLDDVSCDRAAQLRPGETVELALSPGGAGGSDGAPPPGQA